jgi:phage pi2 protein 07
MDTKKLVKLTNIIGLFSIIMLIYWVFAFTSISVFGFKIFRQNMTEMFLFSIFGILAMMSGSLMINIMLNLTRIAERDQAEKKYTSFLGKKSVVVLFFLSFPLLFALLYTGDAMTAKKKERVLIKSAQSVIQVNDVHKIALYRFERPWINETAELLELMSRLDRNYGNISVIVKDEINGAPVYLEFYSGAYRDHRDRDEDLPKKKNFIARTSMKERAYLDRVFSAEQYRKELFIANDGAYALYYPYSNGNSVVVFHFADRMDYGKLGS